ncbi:MAG: aminotransferase class IV [Anaerolineae bacterium]
MLQSRPMQTQTTIVTARLTPAGLIPAPYIAESLNDAARYEPTGVYTVTRTYHRTFVIEFDAHLDRLEQSARLIGIDHIADRLAIRAALRELIDLAGYPETRFRITVPAHAPDEVYFALEPLRPVPDYVRRAGVQVQIFPVRRPNPTAKSTTWMQQRAALQDQMAPETYEGLLTGDAGELLEGFGSNFYAIMDGTLFTAEEGILHGISRRIVLEIAPEILPVELKPVHKHDIPRLAEAFLTSSSRGVIPIVRIDSMPVGTGSPGPMTRRIAAAYDNWVENHLEPL